jgi:hypothetical protein
MTSRLVELSRGVFVYIANVLEGKTALTITDIEGLPADLRAWIMTTMHRVHAQVEANERGSWERDVHPCLAVLFAAREPITLRMLATIAGRDLAVVTAHCLAMHALFPLEAVDDDNDDWTYDDDGNDDDADFAFEDEEDDAAADSIVHFLHKSIKDVLTTPARGQDARADDRSLFVDVALGEKLHCDAGLRALFDDDGVHMRFDETTAAPTYSLLRYSVRQLSVHCLAAQQFKWKCSLDDYAHTFLISMGDYQETLSMRRLASCMTTLLYIGSFAVVFVEWYGFYRGE